MLKVRFRMFITVKDQKYASYQLISIGLIVGVVFYPAFLSKPSYTILAGIVYLWWKSINLKEVRRSVWERFEMEMENERGKIDASKKDKKEEINRYEYKAREELKKLIAEKDSLEKQTK